MSAKEEILPYHYDLYPFIDPSSIAPDSFKGKVVLVTGSTQGIGLATADAFAKFGAKVAYHGRRLEAARKVAKEAHEKYGVETVGLAADGSEKGSMEKLVENTVSSLGPIDIVVANAGTGNFAPFHLSISDDWWRMLEVNLRAPTDLVRAVLPSMLERNSGTIICTVSRGALFNVPFSSSYCVSKAGLLRLMESLNVEYKDTNLRFFALHPASVMTRLGEPSEVTTPELLEQSPAMRQFLTQFYPMLRDAVELPAYTAVFLAHPDGRADLLKGRYIDSNHDLGEIIKRIDVVKQEQMYSLKADLFPTEHDRERERHRKGEISKDGDSRAKSLD